MNQFLNKNGILRVALPTDPGLAWRLRRYFVKKFIRNKTWNINEQDYDYLNATEHVNSIFNLIIILKKHFKVLNEFYYPTRINLADLNIFYIGNFRKK